MTCLYFICGLQTFIQSTSNLLGGLGGHFEFQVVGGQEIRYAGDGQVNQTAIALLGVLWQIGVDILFAEGFATALHGTGGISATRNMKKRNLEKIIT